MKLEQITSTPKQRLTKVLETLKKEYNIEIDFSDSESLKILEQSAKTAIREVKLKESFTGQVKSPQAVCSYLVLEAIKLGINEKWKGEHKTNPAKKGMWDGWSVERLKAARAKLKAKPSRTEAESTRLKEINFALRAKSGWGKVNESLSADEIAGSFFGDKKFKVTYQLSNGKTRSDVYTTRNENEAKRLHHKFEGDTKILSIEELKKKVNESTEIEKAEVLLASKNIVDDLQKEIEKFSDIQVSSIPPIVDRIKIEYGMDKAENYRNEANSLLQNVMDHLSAAKEGIDNLTLGLTGDIDMAAPEETPEPVTKTGMDKIGGEEETAPIDEIPALPEPEETEEPEGRERKESRKIVGNKLTESKKNSDKKIKKEEKPSDEIEQDKCKTCGKDQTDCICESKINESAPPGMEKWVKDRKHGFMKKYGKEKGMNYVYAAAWKMYDKKHKKNESITEGKKLGVFEYNLKKENGGFYCEVTRDKQFYSKKFLGDDATKAKKMFKKLFDSLEKGAGDKFQETPKPIGTTIFNEKWNISISDKGKKSTYGVEGKTLKEAVDKAKQAHIKHMNLTEWDNSFKMTGKKMPRQQRLTEVAENKRLIQNLIKFYEFKKKITEQEKIELDKLKTELEKLNKKEMKVQESDAMEVHQPAYKSFDAELRTRRDELKKKKKRTDAQEKELKKIESELSRKKIKEAEEAVMHKWKIEVYNSHVGGKVVSELFKLDAKTKDEAISMAKEKAIKKSGGIAEQWHVNKATIIKPLHGKGLNESGLMTAFDQLADMIEMKALKLVKQKNLSKLEAVKQIISQNKEMIAKHVNPDILERELLRKYDIDESTITPVASPQSAKNNIPGKPKFDKTKKDEVKKEDPTDTKKLYAGKMNESIHMDPGVKAQRIQDRGLTKFNYNDFVDMAHGKHSHEIATALKEILHGEEFDKFDDDTLNKIAAFASEKGEWSLVSEIEDYITQKVNNEFDKGIEAPDHGDGELEETEASVPSPVQADTMNANYEEPEQILLDDDESETAAPPSMSAGHDAKLLKYSPEDFVHLIKHRYGDKVAHVAHELVVNGVCSDKDASLLKYILEFSQRRGEVNIVKCIRDHLYGAETIEESPTPEGRAKKVTESKKSITLIVETTTGKKGKKLFENEKKAKNWIVKNSANIKRVKVK